MTTKFIPDGYHSVTPVLVVEGAHELIEFLKKTFDAKERFLMAGPGNTVAHAEFTIGDSTIMISDASPQFKPRTGALYIYLERVDDVYQKALASGGKSVREPADQFYGDRSAGVEDRWGNYWGMATHVEDVAPDEIARRAQAFSQGSSGN